MERLKPIDYQIIRALNELRDEYSVSYQDIAARCAVPASAVGNAMKRIYFEYKATDLRHRRQKLQPSARRITHELGETRQTEHDSVVIDRHLATDTAATLLIDVFGVEWVVEVTREIERRQQIEEMTA